MKKYLVFGGDYYYPSGGWEDFQGGFDSLDDAILSITKGKKNACKHKGFKSCLQEWNHIVNSETGEIVY